MFEAKPHNRNRARRQILEVSGISMNRMVVVQMDGRSCLKPGSFTW
jgi:hypothetical protein